MYPVRAVFDGCVTEDEVCGEFEYTDPDHPDYVLCAPSLIFKGTEAERAVFDEGPGYKSTECFPTTLKIAFMDSQTLDVAQYGEGVQFAEGRLEQESADAAPTPLPELGTIDGLTGPDISVDLGGPTTQYVSASSSTGYFPTPGRVVAVDLVSGEATTVISYDNTSDAEDPHSVAHDGSVLWVARAEGQTLDQVGPDGAIVASIELDHAPYALAIDGDTAWVSSFEDSAVMRVNAATGEIEADIDVPSPTGVAVGGGSVWVVEHRDGKLARIDPLTNLVTDEISLAEGGEDPVCGLCVENVIFADGSAWTANNWGRSLSRVDAQTLDVSVISTEHKVWAVTASDEAIWASQYEDDDGRVDKSVGGVVRIDPATNEVEQLDAPGANSVSAFGDRLFLIVAGSRSDLLYCYRVE